VATCTGTKDRRRNDTTSIAEIARGDLAGLKGGIVGPGDPGDNYDCVVSVKAQYDPDNVFRVNQNIQPAAAV
jgi:Berberine and berberine like